MQFRDIVSDVMKWHAVMIDPYARTVTAARLKQGRRGWLGTLPHIPVLGDRADQVYRCLHHGLPMDSIMGCFINCGQNPRKPLGSICREIEV